MVTNWSEGLLFLKDSRSFKYKTLPYVIASVLALFEIAILDTPKFKTGFPKVAIVALDTKSNTLN